MDPDLPQALWPIGQIRKTFPGTDVKVRVAGVAISEWLQVYLFFITATVPELCPHLVICKLAFSLVHFSSVVIWLIESDRRGKYLELVLRKEKDWFSSVFFN